MNKFIAVMMSVCIMLFTLTPTIVSADDVVVADASDVEVEDVVFDTVIDIIADAVGADVPVSAYQDIKGVLDAARSGSYNQTAEAVSYMIFDIIEQVMPVPLPDIVTTPLKNYLSDACADYLFPENPTVFDYIKRDTRLIVSLAEKLYASIAGNPFLSFIITCGIVTACICVYTRLHIKKT